MLSMSDRESFTLATECGSGANGDTSGRTEESGYWRGYDSHHHSHRLAARRGQRHLFHHVSHEGKMKLYDTAREFRVLTLRETALALGATTCDTPEKAAEYWRTVIAIQAHYCADQEQFYVLCLNTRRRITGHVLIALGTLDSVVVHPREVFRAAVITGSSGIVIMHNHPSGCATPSEADIKVTRDLIRAGQIIKIDVIDHVIIGETTETDLRGWTSLRERGYFFMS